MQQMGLQVTPRTLVGGAHTHPSQDMDPLYDLELIQNQVSCFQIHHGRPGHGLEHNVSVTA
jgi:hypothetical protein